MKNDSDMVCVGLEGVVLEESEDAYNWVITSLLEMCPGRGADEYLIVTGDGFFNQSMLERWKLSKAKYIFDHWHLKMAAEKCFHTLWGNVSKKL